jgi:hypothetical protein
VTVTTSDTSGIHRVLVTYTGGQGAWNSFDLEAIDDDTWQGSLTFRGTLEYFVQIVDGTGNVAVEDNDGSYYTTTIPSNYAACFAPDHTAYAGPGAVITYTHILTNTGNGPDVFELKVASSQGWPVNLVGGTATLPVALAAGLTTSVQVNLSVPGGVRPGIVDTTVVTATSLGDPDIWARVVNTTVVAGYVIYLPLVVKDYTP